MRLAGAVLGHEALVQAAGDGADHGDLDAGEGLLEFLRDGAFVGVALGGVVGELAFLAGGGDEFGRRDRFAIDDRARRLRERGRGEDEGDEEGAEIHVVAPKRMMRLPNGSTLTDAAGPMTQVVSVSVMRAGPAISSPGRRRSRA